MKQILFKEGNFYIDGVRIVNPEVIAKGGTHGLLFTIDNKQISDGDTFQLPKGCLLTWLLENDYIGKVLVRVGGTEKHFRNWKTAEDVLNEFKKQ
jgi:hypothetical protein